MVEQDGSGERVDYAELQAVQEAHQHAEAAERALASTMLGARRAGFGWDLIGRMLRMTGEDAQQRCERALEPRAVIADANATTHSTQSRWG